MPARQNGAATMKIVPSGLFITKSSPRPGWQPHSVRGFFSGLVKKKLKLPLTSDIGKDGVHRYHTAALAPAKS